MDAGAAIVATSILLAGCAAGRAWGEGERQAQVHADPGFPELTRASQALREAERQGARADRTAAMHLSLAVDQLAQGRRRLSRGDAEGARWLLLRAEADAHMAMLIVQEAGLRDAARRTLDEATVLHGSGE